MDGKQTIREGKLLRFPEYADLISEHSVPVSSPFPLFHLLPMISNEPPTSNEPPMKHLSKRMRDYMHMADVLIMDDFDRIGSRELTQQEFFNLFNDLFNENKQIVIASRNAPKDLLNVNKLLCARMEWGRIVEIQ